MVLIETFIPGIPYPTLIDSILFLVVSILASRLIYIILHATFGKVSARTKTNLDDLIFRAISKPILLGGFLVGLYLVSVTWDFLLPYRETSHIIFTIAGILYAGFVVIRIINGILEWYMNEVAARTKSKKDEQFLPIIRKVLYGVVGLLTLLWILNQFGIEITTIVAAMGIGGLAVALALQDTLKEFFAGTHVILDRPIRIGDFIELESADKGTVVDIGWRSTTVRTFSGNYVVLPNSKIASSKLINYDMPKQELGFAVDVGIGYGEDLEKVEKVTIDVAKKVLKKAGVGAEDFEPFLRYQGFGDSNIDFKVIFRVKKYSDQFIVKHDFIKALKKEYDRKGIEIAWPIRKVYMAKKKVE